MRRDLIAGRHQEPDDTSGHWCFDDLQPSGCTSFAAARGERAGIFNGQKIALTADLDCGLDRSLIENASKGMALDDQAQDSRLEESRVYLKVFAVESANPDTVCGVLR
jgi:hypothetical protein